MTFQSSGIFHAPFASNLAIDGLLAYTFKDLLHPK